EWLTATELLYGNDHTGVRPGDRPWILEGADVGTPSRERLEAYQAGGALIGWNIAQLREVYASDGVVLGAGMDDRSSADRARSFRHVLDGGSGLFTPQPDTMGYKRLMYRPARVLPPRSGTTPPAATLSTKG
ncbi:MAG: hypothetical protein KDA22_05545, partial [Phycisphaerales bacterium]|nr:hypothetical protein [Phycisphaerales bacterium]